MCNFFLKSESSNYWQKRFGYPALYPVPVWKQFFDIRSWLQTHYPAGYPTGKPDSDHLWCVIYFVAALFKELALITIIEMWGLGLGLGFYDKLSVSCRNLSEISVSVTEVTVSTTSLPATSTHKHSVSDCSRDWSTSYHSNRSWTNVARPWFLLRIDPASEKLGITSLSAVVQWVSCRMMMKALFL